MKQGLIITAFATLLAVPGFAARVDDCGCECDDDMSSKVEVVFEGAPESDAPKPPLAFDMTKCDSDGACAVISPTTGEVLYMTRPNPAGQ